MVTRSLVGRLRQPEYTGENRCLPCTIVNVALVTAAATVAAVATTVVVGAVLFGAGVAVVYLRGYVVPGTPALTSYLPDRVLAYFDHHEPAVPTADDDSSAPDPEQALRRAGAVEECAEVDDLCLTEGFRTEWREAMAEIRANESVEELVRETLGDEVTVVEKGSELHAHVNGQPVGRWPSRTAAVADFAADRVLEARLSNWRTVDPGRRSVVTRGLRPFLDRCPDCEGYVTAEKVTSCCISGKAQTLRHCSNCGTTLFESEPYTDLPEPGA